MRHSGKGIELFESQACHDFVCGVQVSGSFRRRLDVVATSQWVIFRLLEPIAGSGTQTKNGPRHSRAIWPLQWLGRI